MRGPCKSNAFFGLEETGERRETRFEIYWGTYQKLEISLYHGKSGDSYTILVGGGAHPEEKKSIRGSDSDFTNTMAGS